MSQWVVSRGNSIFPGIILDFKHRQMFCGYNHVETLTLDRREPGDTVRLSQMSERKRAPEEEGK